MTAPYERPTVREVTRERVALLEVQEQVAAMKRDLCLLVLGLCCIEGEIRDALSLGDRLAFDGLGGEAR